MLRACLFVLLCLSASTAHAASVRVGVASNFAPTMMRLAKAFDAETGHRTEVMAGSSGALFAQIVNGARFDLFLSADAARPKALVEAARAQPQHHVPYAFGALALWSRKAAGFDTQESVRTYLQRLPGRQLAIANPDLAPYGKAARETLVALKSANVAFVRGQNVSQTFALVVTGNAQAGFVAASQLDSVHLGAVWAVPPSLHAPIRQDMVLLSRAQHNPAATALFHYIQSPAGRALIAKSGYHVPPEGR
ncbi:MAG: molybdate ABC transporter substrate-binding protein [Pseudomonadota bacterium]